MTTQRVPAVGEKAPDFSMTATTGETVTLSQLRGEPVLLAFFPFAFSGVCTKEFCEMTENYSAFRDTGVRIFPVSVDSKYALKEFKQKYDMPVELLSDFDRKASRAYGVLYEDKGSSNRAYFLIDKEGIIRWAHVEEHPGFKRENSEILEHIAELKR
jgi:peroxiredoxin